MKRLKKKKQFNFMPTWQFAPEIWIDLLFIGPYNKE